MGCKSLIEGMLAYKPSKRITIDEIREHPFWSNGKTLDKDELKKRILAKYEEARKARAKDKKKMMDLEHSISQSGRTSVNLSSVFPDTPVIEEHQRPNWHFFYTPLNEPSTETLKRVRHLMLMKFGEIKFEPATHFESPFEFRMTLNQQLKDADGKHEHVAKHVVQVYLRRDPNVQRNIVYFKLLKTDSKLAWIKIWKEMFASFHVYGIADDKNLEELQDMAKKRLELGKMSSVPRDQKGRMVKVKPAVPETLIDDEDEAKEGEKPAGAPDAATQKAVGCGVGSGLFCGAGAADMVD